MEQQQAAEHSHVFGIGTERNRTMNTVIDQLNKANKAYGEVEELIARDEAKLATMQRNLGEQLAASRMGDRGASKRAQTLSMDVGKLSSSLDSLRNESRALDRRIVELEAERVNGEAEAGRERISALRVRTKAAEAEFATLMDQVWDLGRELLDLAEQRQRAMKHHGDVVRDEMPLRPKSPFALMAQPWYRGDHDQEFIQRWKNPVKPKAGPARLRKEGDPMVQSPVKKQRLNMEDFMAFASINVKDAS